MSVLAAIAAFILAPRLAWAAEPLAIVAAENFYGDLARQIGGENVAVTSILNNPDQDPHLFELSPSAARAIAAARIVISNGLGYDAWLDKLLHATRRTERRSLVVAELTGKQPGDNPHIWYDPAAMLTVARALADDLSAADSSHAAEYRSRLEQFTSSLHPIEAKIAALRGRFAGAPVTATEPICGYMFAALGLEVRNNSFQRAVMNNTEPSASDIAGFENDLKMRAVKLLLYNSQASDPIARRMVELAEVAHIPVIAATETEPAGKNYQTWILSELEAVDVALSE